MPNIRSSFDEKLPDVDILNPPAELYRPVSVSSGSTYAQRPPALLVRESANDLALLSQRRIIAASNIPDKDIPELEDTHLLVTEADVTRITTLQLLNPINLVLLKLCPPGIKKIYCNSEITVGKNSRFNILWSFTRGGPEAREMFAVLELKNTYAISEKEFSKACFERDQAKNALEYLIHFTGGPGTYLSGNAQVIAKQAKKYSNAGEKPPPDPSDEINPRKRLRATSHDRMQEAPQASENPQVHQPEKKPCKDIAAFDWISMFIFDFNDADEAPENFNPVREAYFQETPYNVAQKFTFRHVLLGFLIRALERHFRQNDHLTGPR